MKSCVSLLALALSLVSSLGFVIVGQPRRATSAVYGMMLPPTVEPVTTIQQLQPQVPFAASQNMLQHGIENYLSTTTASSSSSSQLVSLQERHIPTAEEIAAKKRNFNLLFWGGGFVAPFAATVFYFGFRFWEK